MQKLRLQPHGAVKSSETVDTTTTDTHTPVSNLCLLDPAKLMIIVAAPRFHMLLLRMLDPY